MNNQKIDTVSLILDHLNKQNISENTKKISFESREKIAKKPKSNFNIENVGVNYIRKYSQEFSEIFESEFKPPEKETITEENVKKQKILNEKNESAKRHISDFANLIQKQAEISKQKKLEEEKRIAELKLIEEAKKKELERQLREQEELERQLREQEELSKSKIELQENNITLKEKTNLTYFKENNIPPIATEENFVTFKDLQKHYVDHLNKIQTQLSSLGGGGEVLLRRLDDLDFGSFSDGDVIKYDAANKRFYGSVTSISTEIIEGGEF